MHLGRTAREPHVPLVIGGKNALLAQGDKHPLQTGLQQLSAARRALARSVIFTPERDSASMRLGLRVWSFPRMGLTFSAFTVDTGSTSSGAVQWSAR